MGAEKISRYERKALHVQRLIAREQVRFFELDRARSHAKQAALSSHNVFNDAREKLLRLVNCSEAKTAVHFMRDQFVSQLVRARHNDSVCHVALAEVESRCAAVLQGVQREKARHSVLKECVRVEHEARLEASREHEQEEVEALFAGSAVVKGPSLEMSDSAVMISAEPANRVTGGGARDYTFPQSKPGSSGTVESSVSGAQIRAEQVQELAIVSQGEEQRLTLNYLTTQGETVRIALNRWSSGAVSVAVAGECGRGDRGTAEQRQRLKQKLSAAGISVQSIVIRGTDASA